MSRRVFLSHNKADKDLARTIGGELVLTGADVWFDEWEIKAGDSIPGALNTGLSEFGFFALLWSVNASRSEWVRSELETAIMKRMSDKSAKIVPCLIDATPLPPLISPIRGIDFADPVRGGLELVALINGVSDRRALLRAVQSAIDAMGISVTGFEWYPPMVCCPTCGADADHLQPWHSRDEDRGDLYAGLRCTECGWEGGGEVPG